METWQILDENTQRLVAAADGQVPLGALGGPATPLRDILDKFPPYSVIAIGSALTIPMLFGPPGR